jgi:effector-binding domain-containing protein
MRHQPRVEERAAMPYIGIHARVSGEAEFRRAIDRGFPELFAWLEQNGVRAAGPPFIRYVQLDEHDDPIEIELGVPTRSATPPDGRLRAGVLPAGRYATLLHVGPYSSTKEPDLAAARAGLLRWAEREGIKLERSRTGAGSGFRACVEHYITDPRREPDPSKWETELAFLTTES